MNGGRRFFWSKRALFLGNLWDFVLRKEIIFSMEENLFLSEEGGKSEIERK
jgi:hypothetical protein